MPIDEPYGLRGLLSFLGGCVNRAPRRPIRVCGTVIGTPSRNWPLSGAMARNFYLTSDMAVPRGRSLREDAYRRAAIEARRFLSGRDRSYLELRARLDAVITDGRRELAGRRVATDDIEAWDTSCRIMFLLSAWQPS
jgi:hypothetical protein